MTSMMIRYLLSLQDKSISNRNLKNNNSLKILNMEFISQTSADAYGRYTITWKDKNGNTVITKHNIFPPSMVEDMINDMA